MQGEAVQDLMNFSPSPRSVGLIFYLRSFPSIPLLLLLSSLQVGNIKAETEITWFKDGIEIAEDDEDAQKIAIADAVLSFNIGKVRQLQGIVGENVGWALLEALLQASSGSNLLILQHRLIKNGTFFYFQLYITFFIALQGFTL